MQFKKYKRARQRIHGKYDTSNSSRGVEGSTRYGGSGRDRFRGVMKGGTGYRPRNIFGPLTTYASNLRIAGVLSGSNVSDVSNLLWSGILR